jgi:hypothetical protein
MKSFFSFCLQHTKSLSRNYHQPTQPDKMLAVAHKLHHHFVELPEKAKLMLNTNSTDRRWLPFIHLNMGWQRREVNALMAAIFLLMAMSLASCSGLPSSIPATGSPTASLEATTLPVTDVPVSPVKGYEVSGTIIAGGDTTPPDLLDAPRKFSYSLQTDDGQIVTITYTAFPPSPNLDDKKIKLNFHAGVILIGDYVKARGSYDVQTKTLVVAEEGDFIETFATKP